MLPVPGNRTYSRAWWVLRYYANTYWWGRGCLTWFWEIRENILKEVTWKLKESVIEGMTEVRTRNEHHKIRLEVESWDHGWLCWTHPPKLQWSSRFPGRLETSPAGTAMTLSLNSQLLAQLSARWARNKYVSLEGKKQHSPLLSFAHRI